MRWRERDGVRWLEATLAAGTRAAFTTRVGGVSEGQYASLNLGLLTGDSLEAVAENRRRATNAIAVAADGVLIGHQVHAARVLSRDEPPRPNPFSEPGSRPPEADGEATAAAGLAPLVLVADCLPVALAGPGGVAMLHCGWRGLAAGIVARGVELTGASAAAIGPGIGPCCYEVGPEVLATFEPHESAVAKGRMLDLPQLARRLLARAGIQTVESAGLCTHCERELFFSARRDGERSGRQAGVVTIDGEPRSEAGG